MTKKEAIKTIEETGAKVVFIRMDHGIPKATVSWKDYLKVRPIIPTLLGKLSIVIK